MNNLFTVTPSSSKPLIEKCIKTGLVPFLQSSPGIGKSSIVKQIAYDYNLELIDLRLSMCAPEDLNGLPRFKDNRAEFVPFSFFPLGETPLPEGKDGWLLFLDEFNSAPRSIQAAAYKLVLDRQVGMYRLHPKTALVAAGNRMEDGAITHQLSTAMQSRLVHLELEVSMEDWLKNVAYPQNYDERIIAFIQFSPDSLMRFHPDKQMEKAHAFSCPRTWEFTNRLIKGEKNLNSISPLLKGTIHEVDVISFLQFVEVYEEIPDIKDILAEKVEDIPKEASLQWAVLTYVANNTDKDNMQNLMKYVYKYPIPLVIAYANMLKFRDSMFLSHPEYLKIALKIKDYLKD